MKVKAQYVAGLDPVSPLESYSMVIMDMANGTFEVIKPKKKRIRRKQSKKK